MKLPASTLLATSTMLIALPVRASHILLAEASHVTLADGWIASEAAPQTAPMAQVHEMLANIVHAALQFPNFLQDAIGAGIAFGLLAAGIVSLIVGLPVAYTFSNANGVRSGSVDQ